MSIYIDTPAIDAATIAQVSSYNAGVQMGERNMRSWAAKVCYDAADIAANYSEHRLTGLAAAATEFGNIITALPITQVSGFTITAEQATSTTIA